MLFSDKGNDFSVQAQEKRKLESYCQLLNFQQNIKSIQKKFFNWHNFRGFPVSVYCFVFLTT